MNVHKVLHASVWCLLGVIVVLASLGAFWLFDARPVQDSKVREVTILAGGNMEFRHEVVRLRKVRTRSVQHFLVDTVGDGVWVLQTHRGIQRGLGKNVYVTQAKRPVTATKSTYKWRLVVTFACNPIKVCAETYESEPFDLD